MTTLAPSPARKRSGMLVAALAAILLAIGAGVLVWLLAGRDDGEVSVYPGARTVAASASTTITLRGSGEIDTDGVRVTGASSGEHAGRWTDHPDDRGATFVPDEPFAAGERVTVDVGTTVAGGESDVSEFVVMRSADPPAPEFDQGKPEGDAGIRHFASRPDLRPPAVTVSTATPDATPGHVFVAPKRGPSQEGPMIVDADDGEPIWFMPLRSDDQAFDFRVQQYRGQPVLTWWQGGVALYRGEGVGRILDRSYRPVATVRAANGYAMDAHEFQLTPAGTALIMSYVPVPWDLSKVGGRRDGFVEDNVIQEIDVETGALLFEWHALGSIELGESYRQAPKKRGQFHDPFHFNSIALDEHGDFVVSARHTNAIYKIDRETGAILWRLGGKQSDFAMGPGTVFKLQHDARAGADGTLTLFDNVAEDLPAKGRLSRGLVLALDSERMRASVAREFEHPGILSPTQGSMQALPGGGAFVGWGGSRREFSEFDGDGKLVWDARFVPKGVESYRAYRMPWSGTPEEPPRAVVRDGRVLVSWNGATEVARWRARLSDGREVMSARTGFETAIELPAGGGRVAVEALGEDGRVLAKTVARTAGG